MLLNMHLVVFEEITTLNKIEYKHTHTHTGAEGGSCSDYLLNIYSLLFTMMCFHILKWPVVPICVIGIHPGDQRRAVTSSQPTNQGP